MEFPSLQEASLQLRFAVDFKEGQESPQKTVTRKLEGTNRTLESFQEKSANEANDLFLPVLFNGIYRVIVPLVVSQRIVDRQTEEGFGLLKCLLQAIQQVAVGFALQSEDGEAHARRKLIEKRLDGIVLNSPESLGSSEGSFSFLRKDGKLFNVWGRISKDACAENILDEIEQMMPHKD